MRVTRTTPREDTPPYNSIFESYGDILHLLFESRQDVELESTNSQYVSMPEPQQGITDFARSGSSEICLVVGSIGIGKTSVIRHLVGTVWPNMGCLVLHHDFRAESEDEPLGVD